MILHDNSDYRIEKCHNTPLPVALDRKERQPDGRICFVNIGWFRCEDHACAAMAKDIMDRHKG